VNQSEPPKVDPPARTTLWQLSLDGWDALILAVTLIAGSVAGVALNRPMYGAYGATVAAAVAWLYRRRRHPQSVGRPSRHNAFTLLAMAIGGIVTILGLLVELGALVSFFSEPPADLPPAGVALVLSAPLLIVGVGSLLLYVGWRFSRDKGYKVPTEG
jgi:hypothetical protein